jgi:hypothetical protein
MKKTAVFIFIIILPILVYSQEIKRISEAGIVLYGFDNFGLTFKAGRTSNVWRFQTLVFIGNKRRWKELNINRMTTSWNLGFRFGNEFRNNINKKLEIRYGFDLSFFFNKITDSIINTTTINKDIELVTKVSTRGINFVFGFNYVINNIFVIGAEILPSLNFTKAKTVESQFTGIKTTETTSFNYGFTTTSALLTFAIRFQGKKLSRVDDGNFP